MLGEYQDDLIEFLCEKDEFSEDMFSIVKGGKGKTRKKNSRGKKASRASMGLNRALQQ